MLRTALDTDCRPALTWRNHPEVRRVSLTTHVIEPEEHRAWWQRATADPDRRVLIFEHDGEPSGVVTFQLDGERVTWGFYLDIAGLTSRRALLPAWMRLEQEAIAYAFDELGAETLGGDTLASNTQVLALHRRFGFRETHRYQHEVDGTPQDVVRTERGRT